MEHCVTTYCKNVEHYTWHDQTFKWSTNVNEKRSRAYHLPHVSILILLRQFTLHLVIHLRQTPLWLDTNVLLVVKRIMTNDSIYTSSTMYAQKEEVSSNNPRWPCANYPMLSTGLCECSITTEMSLSLSDSGIMGLTEVDKTNCCVFMSP